MRSGARYRMENYISELQVRLSACKARSRDRLEYAFYLTIKCDDLCNLYFEHLNNTDIRNKIVRHLKNRAGANQDKIPSWFLDKLMQDFYGAEGRHRISLGTAIKELSTLYSQDKIKVFIEWQILSHSILDRKRAFALTAVHYDPDLETLLLNSWSKFGDVGSLDVLVKHCSDEQLAQLFPTIWASVPIKSYIRHIALKRVAKFDFSKVEFIKMERPVSYLSACVAASKDISDDFILNAARTVDSINELGYIVWCAGKLEKRNVLDHLMDEIETIEAKLPLEFWEPEFYDVT